MTPPSTSPAPTERDIDTIDRRILRVLQADGRISSLRLAEEVHLSPTAVLERVKRPVSGRGPGLRRVVSSH